MRRKYAHSLTRSHILVPTLLLAFLGGSVENFPPRIDLRACKILFQSFDGHGAMGRELLPFSDEVGSNKLFLVALFIPSGRAVGKTG